MAGILVFAAYLFTGLACARCVLPERSPLLRAWLGASFGVLLFMWLPALAAFLVRFTVAAELLALGVLALICGAAFWFQRGKPLRSFDQDDKKTALALLIFALPLTLLSAYLQHTHTLREIDGALYTGQSTYGDLCMHLSIITSLRGSPLPADYSILPGTTLGYPFLTDAMSTSMLLLGTPLRLSIILPGALMSLLVYAGFLLLAREMTKSARVALLAAALLFFNGGLGFLYDFDLTGGGFSQISEIFTGYYKTPANQPEFNLRWSNLVVDLLLPQRTFLGGWVLLLPALYFAREAFRTKNRRAFLLAVPFAGALPLVHTHSFAALGLYCAGALIVSFISDKQDRRRLIVGAGLFLGLTLAMALPQLFAFTLRQATSEGFIRPHIGWVNNTGNGFVDFPIWFWMKNIGLPLLPMVLCCFGADADRRRDIAGATLIFVVADLVLFQPLDYDNNKLFYVWYLLMLPHAASWCADVYRRLRGVRGRAALASLFVLVSTLSGGLSIAREVVSGNIQQFGAADAQAAAFIEDETPPDSLFLTGFHHNNPVFALAGRDVVCGGEVFVFTHGLEYAERMAEAIAFYRAPEEYLWVLEKHGVDYIVVSAAERYDLEIDEIALDALFEPVYDRGGTKIYAVTARP